MEKTLKYVKSNQNILLVFDWSTVGKSDFNALKITKTTWNYVLIS